MFLVVFVTLIISVVGLYAQVLTLQNVKAFNNQTTFAQQMLTWQNTAVSLANSLNLSVPAGGCRLTANVAYTVSGAGSGGTSGQRLNTCTYSGNPISIAIAKPSTIATSCAGGVTGACWTALPAGYQTTPYSFYTLFYTAGTTNYIITYAHDTDASGNLMLPDNSGTSIGLTPNELTLQLQHSGVPALAYGMVSGPNGSRVLTLSNAYFTHTLPNLNGLQTVPVPDAVPSGAVAVVSTLH